MKTERLIVVLCLTTLLVPLGLHAQDPGELLSAEQLQAYLPTVLPGFDVREFIATDAENRNFVCAQVRYYGNLNDASVRTLLCDMFMEPDLYNELLRCSELNLLSDVLSEGDVLSALEPLTNMGTIFSTASFSPFSTVSFSPFYQTSGFATVSYSPQSFSLSSPQGFSLSSMDSCPGDMLVSMVPYESLEYDVAGWQIVLPECENGVLLLGINQRFVLLALADQIGDYEVLENVAAKTDFGALEQYPRLEIDPEY